MEDGNTDVGGVCREGATRDLGAEVEAEVEGVIQMLVGYSDEVQLDILELK